MLHSTLRGFVKLTIIRIVQRTLLFVKLHDFPFTFFRVFPKVHQSVSIVVGELKIIIFRLKIENFLKK